MDRAFTTAVICILLTAEGGLGATVSGRITISRRLTKPSVRPLATAYRRGVVAAPEADYGDVIIRELDRVAVYVESEQPLSAAPVREVIKQRGRRFLTQTVVVPKGSEVSFPNLDPIFHNVFSLSKVRSFDLGNYPKGQTRIVKFPEPGFVKVYCHLHPNMSAVVVVTPSDRSTKPDAEGEYAIPNVPPGEHTVVVWHKSAGFFRNIVRVSDSSRIVVNFDIPIDLTDSTGGP
jgi:plastocyanin